MLTLLDSDALTSRALSSNFAPGPDAASPLLAESLRAELAARGSCLRHVLVRRVLALVAPDGDESGQLSQRLSGCVDTLERSGDVFVAAGGLLAAAPLRVIPLAASRWLVAGGVPGDTIRAFSAVTLETADERRVLKGTEEAVRVLLEALGGRVLSRDAWTGLDRSPPTLDAWAETLATWLDRADPMCPPLSGEVQHYAPTAAHAQRRRWSRAAPASGDSFRLERAWQQGGWWSHHATRGEARVPLDASEAARTAFLLDARAAAPLRFTVEDAGDDAMLTADAWLPVPEHRALALAGVVEPRPVRRWRLRGAERDGVVAMLQERLGVVIDRVA